jgi:hypothetical protein
VSDSLDQSFSQDDQCSNVSEVSVYTIPESEAYGSEVEPMYDVEEYDGQVWPDDVESLFSVKQSSSVIESEGEGSVSLVNESVGLGVVPPAADFISVVGLTDFEAVPFSVATCRLSLY